MNLLNLALSVPKKIIATTAPRTGNKARNNVETMLLAFKNVSGNTAFLSFTSSSETVNIELKTEDFIYDNSTNDIAVG